MAKWILFFLFFISFGAFAETNLPLHSLKLPKGFTIRIYASKVPDARSMTLGAKGTVFVGTREAGNVYAIVADEKNANKKRLITIASGLNMPNGVAFYQGDLYVAEMSRILRFDNIEAHLDHPPKPVIISTALPDKTHHGWRYIKFGPDGKLYIGIGAPCNVCLSKNSHFATIMRMNKDGSHFEVYARGIRNSVGFDWHPVNHSLWFTDNGRDWLGDNRPPDELNHASQKDLNFGFPYCHGTNISDPDYGKQFPCSAFVPPALELPAHVAALGMIFYTGKMFPEHYHHQILIAEHGSWNRSTKTGYQIISAKLQGDRVVETKEFISGWLQNGNVWGRPVDILMMPDGAILISDDYANVIYRVTYDS